MVAVTFNLDRYAQHSVGSHDWEWDANWDWLGLWLCRLTTSPVCLLARLSVLFWRVLCSIMDTHSSIIW